MPDADFRNFILPLETPRIQFARGRSLAAYGRDMMAEPKAIALKAQWDRLLAEPFRGITTDGHVREGLFPLEDGGFDPAPAVAAAQALLASLPEEQRARLCYPADAPEWRAWYNPEIPFNDYGIRLEDTSEATRRHFVDLLSACTSAEGKTKVLRLLKANRFLGELYDILHIMNEWSYHLLIFGTPSTSEAWGWSVYGHHAAFCCFIQGSQLVLSPTFMGVEPNHIQLASGESFTLFTEEERLGLQLMQALPPALQQRAQVFKLMEDPAMGPERFNFADQRHFGGAFQDNRIVPLEGVPAGEFAPAERALLLRLIETFLSHLPDGPRAARMRQIAAYLDETWWSWIGGYGQDDPFYFRIQSPVVMIEFDHHSGMWLSNKEPAKFHIHIITRIPNGNDYGRALQALHGARQAVPAP